MLDNKQEILAPLLIQDLGMMLTTKDKSYTARYGLYKCPCGSEFKTRTAYIKNGHTTSCGCYNMNKLKIANTKHGLIKHDIYNTWNGMKQRTMNKNNHAFNKYGGRGIRMCDTWISDFLDFYHWSVNNGWEKGLSIDRIDNDGNYEPGNCRWTTDRIQARNKRVVQKNNKTGYRGVSLKSNGMYRARIVVDKQHINIGTFFDSVDAAKAYDKYVIDNNLEHNINFPQ